MPNRVTSVIPNTLTCLNLLSGCVAIILAFHGTAEIAGLSAWRWAYIMIAAAAVFDFADGACARMLKAYSPIGADLDSLSDLVSFGVAPAMLMINVMDIYSTSPMIYLALAGAVCGALRLARFNIDTSQATEFRGLPIPANALFLIGLSSYINSHTYPGTGVVVTLCILSALAMVSPMRMFSLKFHDFQFSANLHRYILIIGAALFIILFGLPGLALTVILYWFMSLPVFRR